MAVASEHPVQSSPEDYKEKYILSEKIINEEFKIWKKTSPMLYDSIYSYALEWPSLSVDWFSETSVSAVNSSLVSASFAIGTHTPNGVDNKLSLYSVDLPKPITDVSSPASSLDIKGCQFKLLKEWSHPGEINKLKINQTNGLIATQTNNGTVLVFDKNAEGKPKFELKYHTLDGFGLEWNPQSDKIQLLSASQDTNIALWDLSTSNVTKPVQTFTSNTSIVNDVSWNKQMNDIFASVNDGKQLFINDVRNPKEAIKVENAHESNATCVEFNHHLPHLLVTGGGDNFVNCWDLRNLSTPIRKLYGHSDCLLDLKFSPQNPFLLSSSSFDRRCIIWNLERLADGDFDIQQYEKKRNDYVDPCLAFIHGGHTGPISESAWHPVIPDTLITCARDNLVEVWKPKIYYEEEEEEEEEEEKEEEEEEELETKKNDDKIEEIEEKKEDAVPVSEQSNEAVKENKDSVKDAEGDVAME